MKKITFFLLLLLSISGLAQNTGSLPYWSVMLPKSAISSTDSCAVFDHSTLKWKKTNCSKLGDSLYVRKLTGNVLFDFPYSRALYLTNDNNVFAESYLGLDTTSAFFGYGSNFIGFGDNGNGNIDFYGDFYLNGGNSVSGTLNIISNNDLILKSNLAGVRIIGSNISSYAADLRTTNLTAHRNFEFPNAAGTLALTSDITGTNSGTNTGDETTARINALYGYTPANPSTVSAKLDTVLASGKILIGQSYGGAAAKTPSGDVTIDNAGVTTIGASKVTDAMLVSSNLKKWSVLDTTFTTSTAQAGGRIKQVDWNTFNNKQAALVSGTNLKTVAGTTLLGSGDLGIITGTYGGTGVNNGSSTFTYGANTSITGGGTIGLGGFTLTVPATGTAALLGTAQTFSALNYFSANIQLPNAANTTTPVIYGQDATTGINFGTVGTNLCFIVGGANYFQMAASGVQSITLKPKVNNTYDLGAAALDWRRLYTRTVQPADITTTNAAGTSVAFNSGVGDGSGAASSITFGTPTAGAGGSGAQSLTTRLTIATSALTSTIPIYIPDGAQASPSIALASVTGTGFYRSGATNNLNLTINGQNPTFTATASSLNINVGFITGTSASAVFRTTNAGSNVTAHAIIDPASTVSTAGALAYAFDDVNGFSFTHANGTRRIRGWSAMLTNLVNTAGSESSDITWTPQNATDKFIVAGVLQGNGPVGFASYTVGTLPSAATAGQMIYVSDEAGGAVMAFSDGTNWRRVTDRAIVS